MKIITCDLCKKDMGLTVGWKTVTVPKYLEHDFSMSVGYGREESDICTDCWNEIAEAQNKAVENIKSKAII